MSIHMIVLCVVLFGGLAIAIWGLLWVPWLYEKRVHEICALLNEYTEEVISMKRALGRLKAIREAEMRSHAIDVWSGWKV